MALTGSVFTLKELRDEVLSWLDASGNSGSISTNVDNAINEAHRRRLTAETWPFMIWDTAETFTLADGDQLYTLHHEFHKPFYFYNQTRKVYLTEVSARQLGPSGARWNTDKDVSKFVLWGRTPVAQQPTAASVITIVSSSASDSSAAKAITVRGVTSSGLEEESITPNGASSVDGTKSFSKIIGVTKGAAWAGTATITAGATTLLTLLPSEWGRSYQQLYLLGSPTSADVIEYRFYRLPKRLVNDNDVPDIPPGHEQVLVWDALLALGAYDNRLDGGRYEEWKARQHAADIAFRDAFAEITPVEAEPQYIRDVDGDDSFGAGPTVWLD